MSLKRRRTEIKEIESKPAKLVAFSKRRKGLFNKAKEIGTLCRARVGIVMFSPAGKPYLYGDDVIDEFSTESGMGPEFLDVVNWIESAVGGCRTVDDLESLIRDYESLQQTVELRLKGSSTVASSGGALMGPCRIGHRVDGLQAAPNPIAESDYALLLEMGEQLLHDMPDETGSSSDNIEGGTGTDLSPHAAGSSMTEAEIEAWVNSLLDGN